MGVLVVFWFLVRGLGLGFWSWFLGCGWVVVVRFCCLVGFCMLVAEVVVWLVELGVLSDWLDFVFMVDIIQFPLLSELVCMFSVGGGLGMCFGLVLVCWVFLVGLLLAAS